MRSPHMALAASGALALALAGCQEAQSTSRPDGHPLGRGAAGTQATAHMADVAKLAAGELSPAVAALAWAFDDLTARPL